MRIIYIKAVNIKSIPENSDVLNFCENSVIEGETVSPASTIILGGNGVSKSTFIEGIALLSHVSVMEVCEQDPRNVENPSYIEIKICLSHDPIHTKRKDRDGAKDFVVFVFSAKEDTSSKEFSHEKTALLSSHIVDQKMIGKYWCVYYPMDNGENYPCLIENYKKTLTYNRPPKPIPTDLEDIEVIKALGNDNRNTDRAKKLLELDKTKGSYEELKVNGAVVFINTDLNDFGVALNIFESPKNIRTDLPLVIYHRLPCTKEDGSLRNLKKLNQHWEKIFKYSESNIDKGKGKGKRIKQVICKEGDDGKVYASFVMENNYGKDINIETLSSGENEVFFVLSTIVSLKLYNSVLLLDEPELHLGLKQLHLYYDAIFSLAEEYDLQLIIVTQMPFILGYLMNGNINVSRGETPSECIKNTEMRLLKPEGEENKPATRLSIKESKQEIEEYIFNSEIFKYILKSCIEMDKSSN